MAEQAGFEVRDVENLREHYAMTLRHWARNVEARRAEIVRLAGETLYRTWRLYLNGSAFGFATGTMMVNQSLLARSINGKLKLPLSRADIYAEGAT